MDNSATVTLATVTSRLFRLNSLYDPDLSGLGTQPVGYDQWAAFYNKYRVVSTEVEIRVENRLAESFTVVYFPTDTATPFSGTLPRALSIPGA